MKTHCIAALAIAATVGAVEAEDHATFRGLYVGMSTKEILAVFPKDGMAVSAEQRPKMPPGMEGFGWAKNETRYIISSERWGIGPRHEVANVTFIDGIATRLSMVGVYFGFRPVSLQEFAETMCKHYGCSNLQEKANSSLQAKETLVGRLDTGEVVIFADTITIYGCCMMVVVPGSASPKF